jgi:hypothetical protein
MFRSGTCEIQYLRNNRLARVSNLLAGRCMAQPEPGDVTRLLQSWSGGDKEALGELVPFVLPRTARSRGRLHSARAEGPHPAGHGAGP